MTHKAILLPLAAFHCATLRMGASRSGGAKTCGVGPRVDVVATSTVTYCILASEESECDDKVCQPRSTSRAESSKIIELYVQ